ncbi:unknown [Bacteroides sp. CAG:633]|nr:unknown [Bacteroides sp. CAG:633]
MHLGRLYRPGLFEGRNIRHIFRVEVDLRNGTELTQRLLDCRRQNLPDGLFVLELDFGLGRMNVHIDIGRIDLKINEIRNLLAGRNQLLVSLHHCLVKIGMTHVTPVHEEILMCPFLACRLRLGHIA